MPIRTKLDDSIKLCKGHDFLTALQDLAALRSDSSDSPASPMPLIRHLVLEGGGAIGAAYPGLIQALEEQSILQDIEMFVGSSAGAISAFILALGFNAQEFSEILRKHNLQDLMDYIPESPLQSVSAAVSRDLVKYTVAIGNGFAYNGGNALNFFEMLCQEILGNPRATFKDLEKAKVTNPKLKSLLVTATLVTDGVYVKTPLSDSWIFSAKNNADAIIADAVRASMSIPGIYSNHPVKDPDDRVLGYFSDGGIYNNFPVQVLDNDEYLDPSYSLNKGINDSTLCATLVDQVDHHITRVPVPRALEHKVKTTIPINASTASGSHEQYSFWKVFKLFIQKEFNIGGLRITEHEDLAAKTQEHQHRIVQIQNADVSPIAFNTPKKALLHSHGYIAAMYAILEKLDPRQPDTNKTRKQLSYKQVRTHKQTVIMSLLKEFIGEFNKYKDDPISEPYKQANIAQNVRLQYVAHQLFLIEASPEELTKGLKRLAHAAPPLTDHTQSRYRAITDDNTILDNLHMRLKDSDYNDKAFSRYLNGQLSRGMQLVEKQNSSNMLNLLQSAVSINNMQAVRTILAYIKKTCNQLAQQDRQVTAYTDFINNCQPPLLTIAIENNLVEMAELLLIEDANPLVATPDKEARSPLHLVLRPGEASSERIFNAMIKALHRKGRLAELSTLTFGHEDNTIWHDLLLTNADTTTRVAYLIDTFADQLNTLVKYDKSNAENISLFECFDNNLQLCTKLSRPALPSMRFWKPAIGSSMSISEKQAAHQKKILLAQEIYDDLVQNESPCAPDQSLCLPEPLTMYHLIHWAIRKNSLEYIKSICTKLSNSTELVSSASKCYIDQKYNGKSALYLAAELGHTDIVAYLRTLYAAIENTGPEECPSAMTIAAKNKHFNVVQILVTSKSRAERITPSMKDKHGSTAIHYVAQWGTVEDIFAILFNNKTPTTVLMLLGEKNKENFTAFDYMVRRDGAETVLRELIKLCQFDSIGSKTQNLFFSTFNVNQIHPQEYLSPFEYSLLYNYPVATIINQCQQRPLSHEQLKDKQVKLQEYRADIAKKTGVSLPFSHVIPVQKVLPLETPSKQIASWILRYIPHLCIGLGCVLTVVACSILNMLFIPAIILASVAITLIIGGLIAKIFENPDIRITHPPILNGDPSAIMLRPLVGVVAAPPHDQVKSKTVFFEPMMATLANKSAGITEGDQPDLMINNKEF